MPQSYTPPGSGNPVTVPEFDDFANGVVAFKQFADSLAAIGGTVPVGTLMPFVGTTAPSGWALCDGSNVDAVLNPVLAGLCAGDKFGAAPPGYVKLPDLRSKFPMGAGAGQTPGGSGGATSVVLTEANLPSHSHSVSLTSGSESSSHTHTLGATASTSVANAQHSHTASASNDGGHSHGSYTNTVSATGTSGSLAAASAVAQDQRKSLVNTDVSGGTHSHSVSVSTENAAHSHTVTLSGNTGNAATTHTHTVSGNTGSVGNAASVSTLPPFLTLNFLIKLG